MESHFGKERAFIRVVSEIDMTTSLFDASQKNHFFPRKRHFCQDFSLVPSISFFWKVVSYVMLRVVSVTCVYAVLEVTPNV